MLRVSSNKKQPQRAHCDGENSPTSMPLTIVSYSDRVGGSSMSSPRCMLHCHHVCLLLGRRKLPGKRKCQKWPRLLKGQLTMLTCSNSCLTYRKGGRRAPRKETNSPWKHISVLIWRKKSKEIHPNAHPVDCAFSTVWECFLRWSAH